MVDLVMVGRMASHRIASVEGIVVRAPRSPEQSCDEDPSGEALIVIVRTTSGLAGFGECNHHPRAAHAFLTHDGDHSMGRGMGPLLMGRDCRDVAQIGAELYRSNLFAARRGIGWAVQAALDCALWDLAAQAAGKPLWHFLWGDKGRAPRSYVTIYSGASNWTETQRRLPSYTARARDLGYEAAKVEPLVDCVPEEHIGSYVRQARGQLGDDIALLVDLGYRMPTAERALRAIEDCADSNPIAIETPCEIDALSAWRCTSRSSPIPIAGAELLEHPSDYALFIEAGVQILQPWVNRLGVTGTLDVIEQARSAGRQVILAGWNATSIGVALGVHLAAGLPADSIVLEHAPSSIYGFPLRAALGPELVPVQGRFDLPKAPGLGLEIDTSALARFVALKPKD
jgi:L-alanine-DL-glutamate epimerase-like enolase superfamily enzyme